MVDTDGKYTIGGKPKFQSLSKILSSTTTLTTQLRPLK